MFKSARLPLAAALAPVVVLAAFDYPVSKTIEHVDEYHGTKVADPYRWLEELDSADTKAWVAAQNALTDSVVDKLPERVVIRRRLTELWNYPRTGLPFKEGNWYFYTKNDGLQNQSPLFVREGLQGAERLLIDPNTLSQDGTVASQSHCRRASRRRATCPWPAENYCQGFRRKCEDTAWVPKALRPRTTAVR